MLALLSAAVCSAAPSVYDALDRFVGNAQRGRLSFDYSFTSSGDARMTGSGNAVIQGAAYIIKGNGLEIYSDGRTVASIDRESREVVLEALDQEGGSYLNPAAIVGSLDRSFKRKSCVKTEYSGKQAYKYVLEPVQTADLESVTLYVSPSGSAVYMMSVADVNGCVTTLFFSNFQILTLADIRIPDLQSLGSDYIITDLR